MSTIWAFLTSLPEILKLILQLQKMIQEANTDRKVKDDVKSIHQAFASNDPSKLNSIFNPK